MFVPVMLVQEDVENGKELFTEFGRNSENLGGRPY
jgi:hypothetical protein